MKESEIQAEVLGRIGTLPYLRVWRQNVGVGVALDVIRRAVAALLAGNVKGALVILQRARVVSYGLKGAADLTGLYACGKRLEVEVKAERGRQRKDQVAYQNVIQHLGGAYLLVRSADQAAAEVDAHRSGCTVCTRRTTWK